MGHETMTIPPSILLDRRAVVAGGLAILATGRAKAAPQSPAFAKWVEAFRPRALARGISDATYTRVMGAVEPDTSVYAEQRNQPEFREPTWKYINRRTSAWRIATGKARVQSHAALLDRIEADYGVDRYVMLGLWGMESAFGEVITDRRYMRPVIPALAALAYGEPRRRAYWEAELLNALVIIERKWSTPAEMIGSWAGAMGHTQWMPEVWLHMGVDYDKDGRVTPFGDPGDAFAGTARYLVERGKYRRGEGWGCEVRLPAGFNTGLPARMIAAWRALKVATADGRAFPPDNLSAKLWVPVPGGPAFLLTQNFFAVRSYNPSHNYVLALVHLGDRIKGENAFVQQFPGGERILTLQEMQEVQSRLAALGYDPGARDGRIGRETIMAVADFQKKIGMAPPDGYPTLAVLAKLRETR